MKQTLIITVASLCLLLATGALATTATTPAAPATPPRAGATKPSAPSNPRGKDAVRTLDAIRIEGEIDVPQVLFITARDTRRFRDDTGARYQPTPAGVAGSIPLPARIRVVARPE